MEVSEEGDDPAGNSGGVVLGEMLEAWKLWASPAVPSALARPRSRRPAPAGDRATVARPSCEGPPATAENARLAERFAAKGYWGSFGHAPFHAYAIVQAWAQAAEHAGTFATDAVAQVLHTEQFDTALGRIGFDAKGDVTAWGTYVWHVCQDVEFVPLEEGGQVALSGSQMSHCDRQRGLQRGFFLDEGQAMARCGSLMVRGTA